MKLERGGDVALDIPFPLPKKILRYNPIPKKMSSNSFKKSKLV